MTTPPRELDRRRVVMLESEQRGTTPYDDDFAGLINPLDSLFRHVDFPQADGSIAGTSSRQSWDAGREDGNMNLEN